MEQGLTKVMHRRTDDCCCQYSISFQEITGIPLQNDPTHWQHKMLQCLLAFAVQPEI